jgi:hypothetical protein
MAEQQQRVAGKQSRSKRDKQQQGDSGAGKTGNQQEASTYERELAGYLQKRIKPGLNSGAIPLLARSIAKDIAHRERPNGASGDSGAEDEPREDEESTAQSEDEPTAQAEDEATAEAGDEATDEADDEPTGEADDEATAEADDEETSGETDEEPSDEADDEPSADGDASSDFEADMHDLQAELGEDWILRFSVQGGAAWLTAEKEDGSQRVEAPTASVISDAVQLLNEGGGRGS